MHQPPSDRHTLHCITLHYTTWHDMTLHYINTYTYI
jgi:hypothetical protein